MHVHNAIFGRQLCQDGEWRGIDSRALFRSRAGAAAAGERKLSQYLTRVLGVEAVERADGNGFELKGVEAEQITNFSSRRSAVTEGMKQKVQDYVDAHGRKPNARVMYKMAQEVTLDTRNSKEPNLSRKDLLARWERFADRLELGKLAHLPRQVLGRIDPERNASLAYEPTQVEMDRIVTTAVARVQEAKSVFTRHDVFRRINDELPANLGALSDEQTRALVNGMTDLALSPGGPAGVRLLNAPDIVLIPDELRDEQGRSQYLAPNAERYTTTSQLDEEQELIFEALRLDAPRVQVEEAGEPDQTPEASAATEPVSVQSPGGADAPEGEPGRSQGERAPVGEETADGDAERAPGPDETGSDSDETVVGPHETPEVQDEAPPVSEKDAADPHETSERLRAEAHVPDGEYPATEPSDRSDEAGQSVERTPQQERLLAAHRDAAAWFSEQMHADQGQQARDYAHERGLAHALAEDSPWQVGYGGSKRHALFDHMSQLGYTHEELTEAGLVSRTRGGGIQDFFRERIVLPVRDANGDVVAFMGRKLPTSDHPAKWLNSPESSIYTKGQIMLGLDEQRQALAEGAQPVIVEGLFDILAISGMQDARFAAVAPGGTALTPEQYAALTEATGPEADVLVALDGDRAGQKAAVRAYDLLREHAGPVHAAVLPEGADPGDLATDPDHLRAVLSTQDTHLVDVAVAARVDAHRLPEPAPKAEVEDLSEEQKQQARRRGAQSWGLDPEESEQRFQQRLAEREPADPDLRHRVAQGLLREFGFTVPEPEPHLARSADQSPPEMTPPRPGELTVEGTVAAIRDAVKLMPADYGPKDLPVAQRIMSTLAEQTGSDMDLVQSVFFDELLGSDLEVTHDPTQPRHEWDRPTVLPNPLAETVAAWDEPGRQPEADPPGTESDPERAGEHEPAAPEPVPAAAEGEATPEVVSTHTPRVSEETARALRESRVLRAELMRRYPRLDVDQADAIAGMATSGRGVDVLVGPAGTGKSTTVGYLADLWRERTEAPVVGLATAQNAANILGAKKVNDQPAFDATHNIAKWLHLVESGQTRVVPGSLLVVDEASMVTTDDLAQVQKIASQARAKVVWAGDHHQLTAPGAAGAMEHLTELGGAYHLTTAHRFAEAWEAQASLELREGVAEALSAYDKHGRLTAGSRADMENEALGAYLADYLVGKQTLLLTSTNEAASELSGRVREYLVEAGHVSASGTQLRDTNTAGEGDLVVARGNDRKIWLGDQERALSNRDVLRVRQSGEDGRLRAVLMAEGAETGTEVELPGDYVAKHVELAYAGTTHAAQGRDVATCYSIVDGTVTAEMLYVMLTRAQQGNYGYGVLEDVSADLRIGPEQAQEHTEQLLKQAPGERGSRAQEAERARAAVEADEQRMAVFTAALHRQAVDPMASQAMYGEAERPKDLRHLGAMWMDMTRTYTARGYLQAAAERGVLGTEHLERALTEEALETLGRMLTRLDMAGYEPGPILDGAIASRELDSADEVTQVLYWRIADQGQERGIDVHALEPDAEHIQASWAERTRDVGAPTVDASRHDIAAQMDARAGELAERAAERPPQWLVEHLGPVPAQEHMSEHQQWLDRAGTVLAYREQWSYTSQSEPIGPAPSQANVEQRSTWLAAHQALGSPEGQRDLSGASLGELYSLRAAYERETRWAPAYVADELRAASRQTHQLEQQVAEVWGQAGQESDPERRMALVAQAEARAELAADLDRHRRDLVRLDEARQGWYEATAEERSLAERADQELRRRAAADEREGRQPRVDVEHLHPLGLDGVAGREHERAQQQRAEEQAAAEAEQVHPDQGVLDFAAAEPEPEPEVAQTEEVEEAQPEQLELDLETEPEVEADPETEVDEMDLAEAELAPAAWEKSASSEFETADFVAFGALDVRPPEPEVAEAEAVEEEAVVDRAGTVGAGQEHEVIDADARVRSIEHSAGQVIEPTVAEVDPSEVQDPWARRSEAEPEPEPERGREEGRGYAEPASEPEYEGPGREQPTLWERTIDHGSELDRILDQARHAADLAEYRNTDRAAEQAEAEEIGREQRQREAREVDYDQAEREAQARQELEAREAQRQAEQDAQRQQDAPEVEL